MEKSRYHDVLAAIKIATRTPFSISCLVPVREGEHILDTAFLYGVGISAVRTRPFASVTLDPKSQTLLAYRNTYLDDFADTDRYPMSLKIDYSVPYAKSAREQGELLERINVLYESVRELAWKDSLTQEDKKAAAEYCNCFDRAIPKALIPFYEALSPEFFGWLWTVREGWGSDE